MKTILLTGINGFLGSELARGLRKDYEIAGLEYSADNLTRINPNDYKIYSFTNNSLDRIFEENSFDYIIHAATRYGRKNEGLSNLIQTNILLPVRLVELADKHHVRAFINIDTFFNNPSIGYNYLSEYTFSKRNFLEWINLMRHNVKIVSLRIFHLYGPNDNRDKFVTTIIEDLLSAKKEIDLTPGQQMRDFVYIDDVVQAFRAVLGNTDAFKARFTDIDVGTGKPVTIEEFVRTAKRLSKSPSKLNFGKLPYREGEIMHSRADISTLTSLGWSPTVNIETGIARILKCILHNDK